MFDLPTLTGVSFTHSFFEGFMVDHTIRRARIHLMS